MGTAVNLERLARYRPKSDVAHKKGPGLLRIRGHFFSAHYFCYSAASVSPAGTASSASLMPPLTSMKLRRRLSSEARRRRA